MKRLSQVVFWILTAVAIVTFAVFVRQMAYPVSFEHVYVLAACLASQGVLIIWCLRDLYRRRFPRDRTKLNWFAALRARSRFGQLGFEPRALAFD